MLDGGKMAKMKDPIPSNEGESIVWTQFKNNLPKNYIVYNSRSIDSLEFDFCVVAENFGLFIIEVKGWSPNFILNVLNSTQIVLKTYEKPVGSPIKQARNYGFKLGQIISDQKNFHPLVMGMVCYPNISKSDYYTKRLDVISSESETIFSEELKDPDLLIDKLMKRYNVNIKTKHDPLDQKKISAIRTFFEPNYDPKDDLDVLNPGYSRLRILTGKQNQSFAKDIVDEYFSGIKEIIFLNDQQLFDQITSELQTRFLIRNLEPDRNEIKIAKDAEYEITEHKIFTIFNFEMFLVDNITDYCESDLLIEEGRVLDKEDEILKSLGTATAFNYQQFKVEHAEVDKNIMVSAGAGTGKTYSMVSRIAYLCNMAVNPVNDIVNDIVMLTFTNDAADNMKIRIKRMFMNYYLLTTNQKYLRYIEDMNQFQVSTIHKFAVTLLRRFCMNLGLGDEFDITSESYERKRIYRKNLNQYIIERRETDRYFANQINIPIYELEDILISFADSLFNKSIDIKQLSEEMMGESIYEMPYFNDLILDVVIPSEKEYSDFIMGLNTVDLRQYMIQLNELVMSKQFSKGVFSYKYVFVDEFQDTDDVQIDTICGLQSVFDDDCRLFVVGDIKQSIYRFRGATLSAFSRVIRKSKGDWAKYSLIINYRTDSRLLEEFDQRFEKMGNAGLLPYSDEGSKLISRLVKEENEEDLIKKIETHYKDTESFFCDLFTEVNNQIKRIGAIAENKDLSANERTVALLVRYNWQVNDLVTMARNYGISIEIAEGGDLYRLPPTIDLYKLILALTHSVDPLYLSNLINSNYVSVKADFQVLHGLSKEEKVTFLTQLLDEYFTLRIGKTWRKLVTDFQTRPVLVVLRDIYEKSQPWRMFSNERDSDHYRMNYECLIEEITQRYRREFLTLNMIEKFLQINITTFQESESRKIPDENSNGIIIKCLTVHKSKGLEYGTVILPYTFDDISKNDSKGVYANVIDDKLVYSLSLDGRTVSHSDYYDKEDEIREMKKEESRILYVALTRAIRNCVWIKNLDSSANLCWAELLEVNES